MADKWKYSTTQKNKKFMEEINEVEKKNLCGMLITKG